MMIMIIIMQMRFVFGSIYFALWSCCNINIVLFGFWLVDFDATFLVVADD